MPVLLHSRQDCGGSLSEVDVLAKDKQDEEPKLTIKDLVDGGVALVVVAAIPTVPYASSW